MYARRGEVWRIFEKHFGQGLADVLVVNGADYAPSIRPSDEQVIATAYEDDPMAAAAEYGAEFRRDVEVFLPLEALDAVRMPGRFELPFHTPRIATSASSTRRAAPAPDSMTMAIAHHEERPRRARRRAGSAPALQSRGPVPGLRGRASCGRRLTTRTRLTATREAGPRKPFARWASPSRRARDP